MRPSSLSGAILIASLVACAAPTTEPPTTANLHPAQECLLVAKETDDRLRFAELFLADCERDPGLHNTMCRTLFAHIDLMKKFGTLDKQSACAAQGYILRDRMERDAYLRRVQSLADRLQKLGNRE